MMTHRVAMHRYPLLALAPEGTCKHPSYLLAFSTGAFVGGRPVLPVLLHYRARRARTPDLPCCSPACACCPCAALSSWPAASCYGAALFAPAGLLSAGGLARKTVSP